jgi:hypothetical protein
VPFSPISPSPRLDILAHLASALEYENLQRGPMDGEQPEVSSLAFATSKRSIRINHLLGENIIDPLITTQGLEAFRQVVNETGSLLKSARALSLREVELRLICGARV